MAHESLTTAQVLHGVKLVKSADGAIDLHKLEYIAAVDDRRVWRDAGARNLVEWVSAEFQESHWTARRWVGASQALPELPETQRAMRTGSLSLVKVCELVRFATPATEGDLIRWAQGVSAAAIREGPIARRSIRSKRSRPTTTPARCRGGTRRTGDCTSRACFHLSRAHR